MFHFLFKFFKLLLFILKNTKLKYKQRLNVCFEKVLYFIFKTKTKIKLLQTYYDNYFLRNCDARNRISSWLKTYKKLDK